MRVVLWKESAKIKTLAPLLDTEKALHVMHSTSHLMLPVQKIGTFFCKAAPIEAVIS